MKRLGLVMMLCATAVTAAAQAPNDAHRTIETEHFNVHFPANIEPLGRRAAAGAELAYARLAAMLKPPAGRIDLLLSDHVDYSNGFAYVSPSPRMVVYARPPVDEPTLRFRDDWLDLVIQHELVHVFHLDRTGGWWRVPRAIFGRQPLLFPNVWAPSWLLEGLAVHYESALGEGGRVEGMAHQAIVNSRAVAGTLPRLGQLSSATLEFPGGTSAYAYGSLFLESLGAKPGAIETFVDRTSSRINPWAFDRSARRAFGTTLSEAWSHWRDSVVRAVHALPEPTTRGLTAAQWFTRAPRTGLDGRTRYVGSNGRDVTSVYELTATGPVRVARRNSMESNVALPDGRLVFAQTDFTDPWHYRADLWLRERSGRERPITRGARLFAPDVARDGGIVAVQNVAASTRLVRVSLAGQVTPLLATGATPDTTYSAPRFSHDGRRIAAVRWMRGGTMQIVVITDGAVRVVASARAVLDNPTWSLDDQRLVFAANTDGVSRLWSVAVDGTDLRRGGVSPLALDAPEFTNDGLIAVETRATGDRIVRAELPNEPASLTGIVDQRIELEAAPVNAPSHPYRAWSQLLPRYWLPEAYATDENRTAYGATITSADILDRHFYALTAAYEPKRGETEASVIYRYAGLGIPLVDLAARQMFDHTPILDNARKEVGVLTRRRRFAGASLTAVRQRVRTNAWVSAGAELEWRDFSTDPQSLLPALQEPLLFQTLRYPTLSAAAGFSNVKNPILSISPEDGIALGASMRTRWRSDDQGGTRSTTYQGAINAYRSVPFIPGWAHHVIALRGAAGITDDRAITQLEAGGSSGSSVEIAPGVMIGDARRTYFVRGFDAGAERGTRAWGMSGEWRAPIALPGWTAGRFPFYGQRLMAVGFADAATAWCPEGSAKGIACPVGATERHWLASAGAELVLDAAVLDYDVPYRLRFGWAKPTFGKMFATSRTGSLYFSLGAAF